MIAPNPRKPKPVYTPSSDLLAESPKASSLPSDSTDNWLEAEERKLMDVKSSEITKTNWEDVSLSSTTPGVILEEEAKKSPSTGKLTVIPKIYSPPLSQIDEENSYVSTPRRKSATMYVEVERPVWVSAGWFGSKSYYLYTIVTTDGDKVYSVKRRFRDLDWMHSQLCLKYKGLIIPPLPEKKIIGNKDDHFIEDRRASMEKYLNIIASHHILKSSSAFISFLQCPAEVSFMQKFDREKQRIEDSTSKLEFNNLEDAMDKVISTVQSRLNFLFANKIAPFSKEMGEIENKLNKLEAPTCTLSGAFSRWVQCQHESIKAWEGIKFPELPEFSDVSRRYGAMNVNHSNRLTKLSLDVKEELLKVEGLRHALYSYRQTLDDLSKDEALISRKISKHRASSDEDTAARYLSEIQQTQDNMEKLGRSLEDIERNVREENARFDGLREAHLSETIQEVVNVMKERGRDEKSFWLDVKHHFNI